MRETKMKWWKVHLKVSGLPQEKFAVQVEAETEAGAVAAALAEFSGCYVMWTEEVTG